MTGLPDWAPMCTAFSRDSFVPGSDPARELAAALEMVRRRMCGYSSDDAPDVYCDCKYGIGDTLTRGAPVPRLSSERTGCPELRELIRWLLHG